MSESDFLTKARHFLSNPLFVFFWGIVFAASQLTLYFITKEIGPVAIVKLQLAGFKASYYLALFKEWDSAGLMPFYKAHFIFDNMHWLWYSLFLGGLIAYLMEKQKISCEFNYLLIIPVVAGFCDLFENTMQHLFLSGDNYSMIIDPLPMLSTFASLCKWLFSFLSVVLIVALGLKNKFSRVD